MVARFTAGLVIPGPVSFQVVIQTFVILLRE